jgi:hypothetical protein
MKRRNFFKSLIAALTLPAARLAGPVSGKITGWWADPEALQSFLSRTTLIHMATE